MYILEPHKRRKFSIWPVVGWIVDYPIRILQVVNALVFIGMTIAVLNGAWAGDSVSDIVALIVFAFSATGILFTFAFWVVELGENWYRVQDYVRKRIEEQRKIED